MLAVDDLAIHLKCILHAGIRPGDLVVDPLVRHVEAIQVEVDHVNPVGTGPAAGGPTLHTHRPGVFALAGDLVRKGN